MSIEVKTSRTTYLGGRKYRLECFGNPVQMREDGGEWFDIDPTFSSDGKVTKAPYELVIDLVNKAITMEDKATGAIISIKLECIFDKLPPQSSIPFRDVEPIISGNRIIWEEIVNGVDAIIVAHNTGVSFKRVIKNSAAPQRAEFVIDGEGIPIHYRAYDRLGISIPLSVTRDGNRVTEDCEAREDQYPIEIDPTLTVQPSDKDTMLEGQSPDANYGGETDTYARDRPSYILRTILEFDISELPANVILDSATLQLWYFWYGDTNPSGKTIWAYKLTRTDWVELQATWNIYKTGSNWTAGGGDYVTSAPSGGSTTFPASAGAWMEWNVLAIVQDAYDGSIAAEFLVRFADENKSSGYSTTGFRTREIANEYAPKLVITYTPLAARTPNMANKMIAGELI